MTKFNSLLLGAFMVLLSGSLFAQPANNDCSGAIDLTVLLGAGTGVVQSAGPYDNTTATTTANDPTTGWTCFGEPDGSGNAPALENTMWYSFTGDGNLYFIEATSTGCSVTNGITDNDTQIAIYSGSCGAFVDEACNEDGPNASTGNYPSGLNFQTMPGVTYYMMVDGFAFNGVKSEGEYCVTFEQQASVTCSDPAVSGGTVSVAADTVCAGTTVDLTVVGQLAPTSGAVNGYSWVLSTADLAGSTSPNTDGSFQGGFPILAAATTPLNWDWDAGGWPAGTYYFTLVAFGNATDPTPADGPSILDVTFDPACTFVSNSVQVTLLPGTDPACGAAPIACGDATINAGTVSGSDTICNNELTDLVVTGSVAPNSAAEFGFGFAISTADISGSADPLNEASLITGSTVTPVAQAGAYAFDLGGAGFPSGTYYFTPVVFGNATTTGTFLNNYTLDLACTYTGTSFAVTLVDSTSSFCLTGLIQQDERALGVESVFPNPASSNITLDITAANRADATVAITSITGQTVIVEQIELQSATNTINYDISALPAGMYMITVRTAENIATSKFVKQ